LTIAADVRLHNREDLVGALGIDPVPARQVGDSYLLLAAYEKWGEECGCFLLGEFAFAIWDGRRRRLFCCRDQIGFRPFVYWRMGPRFLFASTPGSILAAPDVPRKLNRQKLAGMVIGGGQHYYPEDTFHAGIVSLPAASWLTVDMTGVRQQLYWEPEIRPELVPRKPEDAFEALRQLLFKAVECRLEDGVTIAAELSGGLDSSAVTAIAARHLENSGRNLLALSAVLPEDRRNQALDEREFIDQFRSWPGVRIEYVTAPGNGPFDSIETPDLFADTPLRTSRFYLYEALERAARSNGTGVVLRGDMGELGPSCKGQRYYTELAVKFQWLTLSRELHKLHTIQGTAPLRCMASRVRELLPHFPGHRFDPFVLLTGDFARSGRALPPLASSTPNQRQHQAAVMRRFLGRAFNRTGQTVHGHIRTSDPLLDKRVLEFCLAAPPNLKVRNGYGRYLIRGSLDGVLPRKIQWRTGKLPFSPDYFSRYNAQLPKAREWVAAVGEKDPIRSVIDVERLGKLLQPVEPGVRSKVARDTVPATIYAICFLRQFPEYRP